LDLHSPPKKKGKGPKRFRCKLACSLQKEIGGELLPAEDVIFSAYSDIAPRSDDYKEND
jgi:hypothetical protein